MKVYNEDQIVIIPEHDEQLKQFHPITAAGGLVINDSGNILMIFRRGKWDLPKGKLDDGESLEECARRETIEETGLQNIILKKFLLTTYHTYVEKQKLIIKDTHWYLFAAPGQQNLVPQTNEDILKAEWVNPAEMDEHMANTFLLIKDVLNAGGFSINN